MKTMNSKVHAKYQSIRMPQKLTASALSILMLFLNSFPTPLANAAEAIQQPYGGFIPTISPEDAPVSDSGAPEQQDSPFPTLEKMDYPLAMADGEEAYDNLSDVDQSLGLDPSAFDDEYLNWFGENLNEKWLASKTGTWYYITPDGKLYQWHGGSPDNDTLVNKVDPAAYRNTALLYNAQANNAPASAQVRPADISEETQSVVSDVTQSSQTAIMIMNESAAESGETPIQLELWSNGVLIMPDPVTSVIRVQIDPQLIYKQPIYKWKAVDGATDYQIDVYDETTGALWISQLTGGVREFPNYFELVDGHTYRVEVSAIRGEKQDPATVVTFEAYLKQNEPNPKTREEITDMTDEEIRTALEGSHGFPVTAMSNIRPVIFHNAVLNRDFDGLRVDYTLQTNQNIVHGSATLIFENATLVTITDFVTHSTEPLPQTIPVADTIRFTNPNYYAVVVDQSNPLLSLTQYVIKKAVTNETVLTLDKKRVSNYSTGQNTEAQGLDITTSGLVVYGYRSEPYSSFPGNIIAVYDVTTGALLGEITHPEDPTERLHVKLTEVVLEKIGTMEAVKATYVDSRDNSVRIIYYNPQTRQPMNEIEPGVFISGRQLIDARTSNIRILDFPSSLGSSSVAYYFFAESHDTPYGHVLAFHQDQRSNKYLVMWNIDTNYSQSDYIPGLLAGVILEGHDADALEISSDGNTVYTAGNINRITALPYREGSNAGLSGYALLPDRQSPVKIDEITGGIVRVETTAGNIYTIDFNQSPAVIIQEANNPLLQFDSNGDVDVDLNDLVQTVRLGNASREYVEEILVAVIQEITGYLSVDPQPIRKSYYDQNNDGYVTPQDILILVNLRNAFAAEMNAAPV